MNRTLLNKFGLKWNPFLPDIPLEALRRTPPIDGFLRRIQHRIDGGGFFLICGEPGTGKSCALRLLADQLSQLRDVAIGIIEHPKSSVSDFYRELGHLFNVSLNTRNRWGGFNALREKWKSHLNTTLCRPILFFDESQDAPADMLKELRILTSADFDSQQLLTVIFAGDDRFSEMIAEKDLLPLGSRIRTRLKLDFATPAELGQTLRHWIDTAGNPKLMSEELIATVCEHAVGNYRTLASLCDELLVHAFDRNAKLLDEKLYFEVFAQPTTRPRGQIQQPKKARAR
jgi:type II secretory pathway predicted ATPase ExeA